jgi:hypothetical protein
MLAGGQRGIRTPGELPHNSFQDCRIKPLCHLPALIIPERVAVSYLGRCDEAGENPALCRNGEREMRESDLLRPQDSRA